MCPYIFSIKCLYRGSQFVVGLNVPGSKLDSQSYWYPQFEAARTNAASTNRFIAPANGNTLFFGGWNGTYAGNLSPEDAWNIDTKMDDGKPAKGKMWAPPLNGYSTTSTNCTNAADATDTNANYLLTNPNKDCQAYYIPMRFAIKSRTYTVLF